MSAYDPDNIFGKVLRGEVSSHKVYEDADVLAIMDLFPQSRGHTLVIPKAASRNFLDADAAAIARIVPTLQRLARAVKAGTKADGLRVAQFNEAPAGQTVFHLHFHLIPMYAGVELGRHGGARADDTELRELAKTIAGELAA